MLRVCIEDIDLSFETDPQLFSPRRIDAGTLAMLSCVRFNESDKVLDLGCGYGPVGILAAKLIQPVRVCLLDNDPTAIAVASKNARINGVEAVTVVLSDGFRNFEEAGFTKILCNPPYHADFAVPKHFIHKGFNRLVVGGTLWMVTQRQAWYRNKLRAIFGSVKEHPVGSYTVFEATKRSSRYAAVA
jgi:16S rRNA (guanine1207-N2)-methyltransferase